MCRFVIRIVFRGVVWRWLEFGFLAVFFGLDMVVFSWGSFLIFSVRFFISNEVGIRVFVIRRLRESELVMFLV